MSYKILLADDSFTILDVMTFAFENNGFEITTTSKLNDVFELIKEKTYDVIIIDNDFQKNDLITEIKKSKKNKDSYIFILSKNSDSASKHKAKKLGASGWIIKPFIPEKLVKTIESFLVLNKT